MLGTMSTNKKPGRRPNPDSKRQQGVSRHTKPRKAFHADQALFDAMAAYIADTRPMPTDTQVLIAALEDFLAGKGYWPPKSKEGP